MFNRTNSTKFFAPRRQDRKEKFFLFLQTWRPLWFNCAHHPESIEGCLCGSPRGISFPQKRCLFIHGIISRGESRGIPTRPRSSCSPEALFHRARPVEYLIDRKYIGFAVKLFHRASHRLSDSLNPNSTENFKYVWFATFCFTPYLRTPRT